MSGTEWTEPGMGATCMQIARRVVKQFRSDPSVKTYPTVKHLDGLCQSSGRMGHRTNLKLTGAPLTAEDLKRIAECK